MPAAAPQSVVADVTLDEADIRRYREDGAICLRGLFTDWVPFLREATERVLAGDVMDMSKAGQTGRFVGDVNMWQKDEAFRTFAFEGPSAAIAKTLMKATEVRLFADQLFVKEPGASTPTPWHHDQPYWPVLGDDVCSIWVTMDSVTRQTSGLEYIKGSHLWDRRFDPEDFGETSLEMFRDAANEKIPDIEANRDAYEFLSWDMEPGDCLIHHSLSVHGAGGNTSASQRRRAISTRWLGDDCFYRPHGPFQPEVMGVEPGARMTSPMFPVVI